MSIEIDLPHARILSYVREGDALQVAVRLWNEKLVTVRFTDVVRVHDWDATGSELYDIAEFAESPFLAETRTMMLEDSCQEQEAAKFKHVALLRDGEPSALDVVCRDVALVRE